MEKLNEKTGTTTLAMKYKDGVLLAADRQSTAYGRIVHSNKRTKMIEITETSMITTAGSIAETRTTARLLKAEIKLFQMKTGRKPSIPEIASLLSRIQLHHYESHLLFGGIEGKEKHVFDVMPGLKIESNYKTTGSGGIFALSVLDTIYKKDLTEKEAIDVAVKTISTSIGRDVYSGGGITISLINDKGIKTLEKEFELTNIASN